MGNSGSGKSTLSRQLAGKYGLAHMDLDTLAWQRTSPPKRRELNEACKDINHFLGRNKRWVIEGCYADLLKVPKAELSIFMNLPIAECQANAKARPWEPHKYPNKEAQDANLTMLLKWIADYEERQDFFSKAAHQALFDEFSGQKIEVTENMEFLEFSQRWLN